MYDAVQREQWDEKMWIELCCKAVRHNPKITNPKHTGFNVQFNLIKKVELMPHQWFAIWWMLQRERSIWNGGILGDIMGLGKVSSHIIHTTIDYTT